MRPKKKILLISSDEQRIADVRFVLATHGYATRTASTAEDALALALEWRPELLLVQWLPDEASWAPLIAAIHAEDSFPRALIMAAKGADVEDAAVDVVMRWPHSPEEMLMRARMLAVCKRGPKPLKKPLAVVPAVAIPAAVNL